MFKMLWPETELFTKSTRFTRTKSLLERLIGCQLPSRIDFKIATLTYKAVHLKQPPCLAQHLKLKSMHLNTRNNDQLLLQHPSVGTNSYIRRAFSYTAPTVWNKLPYKIRNAPSVTLFRKNMKTLYFKTSSRPPDGRVLPGPEVYEDLTLPDMWILTLINISEFVSRF